MKVLSRAISYLGEKSVKNPDKLECPRRSSGTGCSGQPIAPVKEYPPDQTPLFAPTPCLDFSHRAFNLIAKSKHKPIEMRVVTIVLNDDTLDRRGGPLFGYGKDKHAMLLVDGTIYDNGYLTDVPFDYEYFSHYGREIDNMWSPKEYR